MARAKLTPHQKTEAELTKLALSWPEVDVVPAWSGTRYVRVRKKGFCVFGAERHTPDKGADELSIIMKLPVSAGMIEDLYYVQPTTGWYKRHDWVIAKFGPDDDILSEMDTLKGWLRQSYCAMAPKKLARMLA